METDPEKSAERGRDGDRSLFGALLKHVVRSAPNEDPTDFVLESIGRNVGADRCYVYRFWEPGKSSMCTNTHEWCAEGIKPEIGGQQTCNLADLVEFNARITSGRDFLFTDIDGIDQGSQDWLRPQGIQSLIATPLVGADDAIVGFAGFDFVRAPCAEFTDRIVSNIHEAADLLLNCQRLHERDVALLDASRRGGARLKSDRELDMAITSFMKNARAMQPGEMLEFVRRTLDADVCSLVQDFRPGGGGSILPGHAVGRDGWTNARGAVVAPELGRALGTRLLTSSVVTLREGELALLRRDVGGDVVPPGLAGRIKVVHSTAVLHGGRFAGVLSVSYAGDGPLDAFSADFLRRAAFVVVSALERVATNRDLAVALDLARFKGDIVEFMFTHRNYADIQDFIGAKVREASGAQHLMLSFEDGSRVDWFGDDAPARCRDCVKAAGDFGRRLPAAFFSGEDTVIVREGEALPDMNLPPYCPMRSTVVSQFRRGDGWWRLVADYTAPHRRNLDEVARCLRMALELLAIAFDRERHEETISLLQEHQRFRADTLAFALSNDDLPALIDRTLRGLLKLTACDYIAIHTADGDHRLLHPDGDLVPCPARCRACAFYKFQIPDCADSKHLIELQDAHGQTVAPISPECPAQALEVAVVKCDGKPWGGIALHYYDRSRAISEEDRDALRIAADALTLALERHSSAIRLKAERDRAMEAEKAKSYFFSAVSHDIRTPLNAIIGFAELLQTDDVPPDEARRDLRMIMDSGRMLLQLVNDVLDLSKLDFGKLEFQFEPTDVEELVRDILPLFKPSAEGGGQTFVTDLPGIPRLMVDPHRVRQVLFNFISNAVKYAGPCTIRISVGYADGRISLAVADDGKGVPAEQAKLLMEPFVQGDLKNRAKGIGLGLAICKRLVELAGGTVAIKTAPGEGFEVRAEFPADVAPERADGPEAGAAAAGAPSPAPGAPVRPLRILVVDDVEINALVLKAMLKKFGVTDVEFAENGKAALEALASRPPFDLVMSDMWMPVMDGAELIGRIRADPRFSGLKACAITADVETRKNYRQLGFDAVLLKPITMEGIEAALRGASA